MVRRAAGAWADFDESQREFFAQPVGIRTPDGRLWNLLGKVASRFELGPAESLLTFYPLLHGRSRPEA